MVNTKAEELNASGLSALGKAQHKKAIECFNKAIELDQNLFYPYYNRGTAYNNLKQYERAIEDFDKAIELKPDFGGAYNNRGLTYYYLKEYERAIEDYNKKIELNPNDSVAYNNRGLAYKDLGQPEKATESFKISKTIEQSAYTTWDEVIFGGIISGIIAGLFGFLGREACIFVMFIMFLIGISWMKPSSRGFFAAIIMAVISSLILFLITHL